MKLIFFSLLSLCLFLPVAAIAGQQSQADSLETLLSSSEGKSKIKILNELSFLLASFDPERGIYYGEQAYDLAVTLNDKEGQAQALEYIGWGYFYSYDFLMAANYLTKSLVIYKDIKDKEKIARIMQNIGLAYLQASDYAQAELYLLEAADQFQVNDDQGRLAYCFTNLGLVSYMKGEYATALDFYETASGIYKDIDDPDNNSELLNRIGMTYWSLGINDKALHYMLEFIKLLKPDYPKAMAIGYNNIGAIYRDLANDEKALEFYRKAVVFYELAGDSLDLPSPLSNIGTIFSTRNNPDSALYYYKRALEISDVIGDRLQSAKTKHNIALIYSTTGQFNEANDLLMEFLHISREIGYKEGQAHALLSLGNLSKDHGNIDAAIRHYRDCLSVADSIKLLQVQMNAHLALSKILEDDHQDKEALYHFQRYNQVKDTIFNAERTRIITELETRYETEKKQQENELLIKDNELKDKQINTLYLIIAGIVIITFSIILLIISYRRNTLNKKRLAESEAARLAEKVEYQNQELANGALALSRNLSFLNKLLEDLKSLSSHVDEKGIQNLKDIIRNIQHLDTDPAWSEFEMRFQKVHARFYDKLTSEFPTLTTNEMRLCALIKLGMNTKEVSTVTFQNIRAIEAARLRLRKKLHLDGNEDLGAFLQKI